MKHRASNARTAWVIWYCISLHVVWGLLLLYDPAAQHVTGLSGLIRLVRVPEAGAAVFLGVGVLAGVGLCRARAGGMRGLLEVLPQQSVLVVSAVGACEAVWLAHYADGVPRPRAFIAADQVPAVLIAAAHTLALVDCFLRGPRPATEAP